jgi:hypothetical protein
VLRYWSNLIRDDQAQDLANTFAKILANFVDHPSKTIAELDQPETLAEPPTEQPKMTIPEIDEIQQTFVNLDRARRASNDAVTLDSSSASSVPVLTPAERRAERASMPKRPHLKRLNTDDSVVRDSPLRSPMLTGYLRPEDGNMESIVHKSLQNHLNGQQSPARSGTKKERRKQLSRKHSSFDDRDDMKQMVSEVVEQVLARMLKGGALPQVQELPNGSGSSEASSSSNRLSIPEASSSNETPGLNGPAQPPIAFEMGAPSPAMELKEEHFTETRTRRGSMAAHITKRGRAAATEKKLLGIWSSLLDLPEDSISSEDSFFELGKYIMLRTQGWK